MSDNPAMQWLNAALNAAERSAQPARRHKAPEGECKSCDRERTEGNDFHPSHDPSRYCESGKHNHCSCDWCF